MYADFFGCTERPFDLTPNPRYLVLLSSHREALSSLEYAIANRIGITLLTGEAGSGKTTIIRTALQHQPMRVHCVHISNPALTRGEFVEMLASLFNLSDSARQSKTALLCELEALLKDRHLKQETTVLIVDEAQSLPLELLEEIRLLANIETSEEKLLSVIISGQPELLTRLEATEIRQLRQRIALRCELQPLSLPETAAYIAGRSRAAGGVGADIFSRDAVVQIHEHSGGNPRTINLIADNALLSGFAAGQRPITKERVKEVCRDLGLKAHAHRQPDEPPAGFSVTPTTSRRNGENVLTADWSAHQESERTEDVVGVDEQDSARSVPAAKPTFSIFGH